MALLNFLQWYSPDFYDLAKDRYPIILLYTNEKPVPFLTGREGFALDIFVYYATIGQDIELY